MISIQTKVKFYIPPIVWYVTLNFRAGFLGLFNNSRIICKGNGNSTLPLEKKKSSFQIVHAFSILKVSTEIALCMKCHKSKIAIASEEILTLKISSYFKIYFLLVKKRKIKS